MTIICFAGLGIRLRFWVILLTYHESLISHHITFYNGSSNALLVFHVVLVISFRLFVFFSFNLSIFLFTIPIPSLIIMSFVLLFVFLFVLKPHSQCSSLCKCLPSFTPLRDKASTYLLEILKSYNYPIPYSSFDYLI